MTTKDSEIIPVPVTSTPLENVEQIRKPRKKVASIKDTAYLKAPKVIPGGSVIYLSRLPHGFYESELRSYLGQFGEITRLRLSRNPRTGASRHYAFVEFRHAEVARIVAETMNNYLLAGHLIQCQVMAEERIHEHLWKGANRKFVVIPWRKIEAKRYNNRKVKAGSEAERQWEKGLARFQQLAKAKGIEYDVGQVVSDTLILQNLVEQDKIEKL